MTATPPYNGVTGVQIYLLWVDILLGHGHCPRRVGHHVRHAVHGVVGGDLGGGQLGHVGHLVHLLGKRLL